VRDATRPNDPIELVRFASPPGESDLLRIQSGLLYLAAHSDLHRTYADGVLQRRTDPALALGQFHYHTDASGLPVAFCNWVWLSPDVFGAVTSTGRDLEPHEFRCGAAPFFYEFLAPFGHARAVVRALRDRPEFRGRAIPAIRGRRADGGPLVKTFHF
jgi:cytolysin-activating lysine-acyltransferase